MEKTTIRLGGVPEHFNLPIHLAREDGQFESRGVDIQWIDFPGGTGEMTKALAEGEVDACILLTEGAIASIINGNPSKIISDYVITPLTWGIHTGVDNSLKYYQDIWDKKFAISRFGSGSHLMPIVDAHSKGKNLQEDQFVIIGNLDSAIESLVKGDTDVFYWEKFTTKPYVDKGELRRIGEYRTPWPCFVIAATDQAIGKHREPLIRMLRTIHDSCDRFMQDNNMIKLVSARYGIEMEDAESWYHTTEWAIHGWVSDKMMKSVVYHLLKAGIVSSQGTRDLIWKRK